MEIVQFGFTIVSVAGLDVPKKFGLMREFVYRSRLSLERKDVPPRIREGMEEIVENAVVSLSIDYRDITSADVIFMPW